MYQIIINSFSDFKDHYLFIYKTSLVFWLYRRPFIILTYLFMYQTIINLLSDLKKIFFYYFNLFICWSNPNWFVFCL